MECKQIAFDKERLDENRKNKLEIIDLYTDGLGSYICNLIESWWADHEKFKTVFGDKGLGIWLLKNDTRKVVEYFPDIEKYDFKFLSYHHDLHPHLSMEGVIDRMYSELRIYMLKALKGFDMLGIDYKTRLKSKSFSNIINTPHVPLDNFV